MDWITIATGLGGLFTGAGGTVLGGVIRLRGQRREDFDTAFKAMEAVTSRLEGEVRRLDGELVDVRAECDSWRRANEECLAREARLTSRVADLEERLEAVEARSDDSTPTPITERSA